MLGIFDRNTQAKNDHRRPSTEGSSRPLSSIPLQETVAEPKLGDERPKQSTRWTDNEVTNEEHLQITWGAAKLVNIDREMDTVYGKEPKNYALIQANSSTLVLIVIRSALENTLALQVLQNVVERRSSGRLERYLVSNTVFTTVLDRLNKKTAVHTGTSTLVDSETLREFKEVVKRAVQMDASDIHFRGDQKVPRIDFRILGTVHNSGLSFSYDRLEKLSRAAYGTQAEKGSNKGSVLTFETQQRAAFPLELEIDGRTQLFKLRFELTPCQSGFHAVMRILWMSGDKARKGESLEADLLARGYMPDQARSMSLVSYKNGGSMILAGQTGSGKTQTLYNIMRQITTREKIAIAVEDPVEGDLDGVTQIQVATREGQSVDDAVTDIIKSILRLDPDIALISELRGKESAAGFQQLLQSGHKTLTTVHADSPIGIYERLASDQFMLDRGFLSTPDNLSICVFQNLIQRVCPHCALRHDEAGIDTSYMHTLQAATGSDDLSMVRFRNRKGCPECKKVSHLPGIAGREVAASVLIPDDEILLLLRDKKVLEAIREFRSRKSALYEPNTIGKSAMEVATYKVLTGRVDPREVESVFESFELYAMKNRRPN